MTSAPTRNVPSTPSRSDSLDGSRFAPGTMLAGRYRIVGMLGRGGMGEVYRADDLTLGQPVALKFLPEPLARDEGRLARFLAEVRIARQISHPNVCRVYDISQVDGQHFISMEYVDGEDLASLLKRIGRYPKEKGAEISRQICAGVAAAHDIGVLHRDLKPANIMIDGRGKVRITDFGLASLAGEVKGKEIMAGTPAYMSPEQLKGEAVSIKSDIYSLGLILFEIFTGARAHEANTREEQLQSITEGPATTPSSIVPDMEPAVERIVLRCLEEDPNSRPSSALAVASALPGGDPLAAALAAGEIPSPEMVAAAGEEGALSPRNAWIMLLVSLAGIVFGLNFLKGDRITRTVPMPHSPQALADRAREAAKKLGYDEPVDQAFGFTVNGDYLSWLQRQDPLPDLDAELAKERPAGIQFWYRQSPRYLDVDTQAWSVNTEDPPLELTGEVMMTLDPRGRLTAFDAVPAQLEEAPVSPGDPNWAQLFDLAGLELASFSQVDPLWNPRFNSTSRAAWVGELSELPGEKIRVEAAAYGDRPVFFQVIGSWTRAARQIPAPVTTGQKVGQAIGLGLLFAVLLTASILAWRNLKAGRGDRAGALRFAGFFLVAHVIVWFLTTHYSPIVQEMWGNFTHILGGSLFMASMIYVLYLALEPFVRRNWPDTLISWSRLLAGRFRDPRVGRDVLIGLTFGSLLFTVMPLVGMLLDQAGYPDLQPSSPALDGLNGSYRLAGWLLDQIVHASQAVMLAIFLIALLRHFVKKLWLTALILVGLGAATSAITAPDPVRQVIGTVIVSSLLIFSITRFGVVTTWTLFGMMSILGGAPLMGPSGWGAGVGITATLLLGGLAIYSFHASLGGHPLFGHGAVRD